MRVFFRLMLVAAVAYGVYGCRIAMDGARPSSHISAYDFTWRSGKPGIGLTPAEIGETPAKVASEYEGLLSAARSLREEYQRLINVTIPILLLFVVAALNGLAQSRRHRRESSNNAAAPNRSPAAGSR